MLSKEIQILEQENHVLRKALEELSVKMKQNSVLKPRNCQYCMHYMQHYIRGGMAFTKEYIPIYDGHCVKGVPIKSGGKRRPKPDDTCPYFELGGTDMRLM